MHLLLPLLSSLLYVAAVLFLKQAGRHQVGVWRITFLCNWSAALLFLSLWPLGGAVPEGWPWWQPALVALLYLAGQVSTFLALDRGDVSVATPVMGSKVVLVALLTTLILRQAVSLQLWAAAGLSCLGIAFLNQTGSAAPHRHVGRTIWFALQAAASYALFDVLVIKWSPAWGVGRFLPVMMLLAGVYSLALVPLFRRPLRTIPRAGWRPVLLGALFMGLQAVVLVSTLARFGDATAVNVIYSSRGLWSVLAVWWLGGWFENTEHELGWTGLKWRLAGAVLLSAAIALVFW